MNENCLNFLILFRRCTNDPVYVREFSNSFFKELRDSSEDENDEHEIIISEAKNIDIDSIYKADLHELEISLKYFTPQDYKERFAKIIESWCDSYKNKLSNLWLQIANPTVLKNTGKLHHSDVDIKEIAFGSLPDMQHFMQHYHYVSNSDQKEISCSFLHSQRKLMIYTCFTHSERCTHYKNPIHNKFQFSYESIVRVLIYYIPGSDMVEIYFHLRHTPFLYIKKNNKKKEEPTASVSFLASDQEYQAQTWERVLDFGCSCKNFLCATEAIGKCPIFKIVIPKKHKTYDVVERLLQRCFRETAFYFTNIKTEIAKKGVHKRFLRDFEIFPFNNDMLRKISDNDLVKDIKFKCQFAWEVLNCRSLEIKDQISLKYKYDSNIDHWEKLKDKLKSFYKQKSTVYFEYSEFCDSVNMITDAIVKSFYDISEMISKNHIFTFEDAFDKYFEHNLKSESEEEVPDGMCLVRRIVLTPSKILCLPPSEHFDNRVIRHFETEHFLRVSIQDDNFQKLTFAVQYNSKKREFLSRVVGDILLEGITIGPRKYEILAASNSQLREHGLWMYSQDKKGHTSEFIRNWMGNFQKIKNVAKYMARMGQCFSTSDEAVQIQLKDEEVVNLPEVVSIGERYKFSDGVGMISKDLAEEVRKAFNKRHNPHFVDDVDVYQPSAFQIRFKGCKGMLAEADPKMLDGRKIGIRESMEKFPCSSSTFLEIVKISAPRAVYLNRPLITILENLGVPSEVFLELQKKMVFDLTDSLIYEKKAYKMLENCTSLKFPFKKLSMIGISMTQEPFFRSLLLCVYKSMIGNLKHKARIAVPPKYGRNMLGVMDETKTLKYGQIFVQYSKKVGNMSSKTKILKGTVVVTKNPCMHPGDVRKLEAVDVEALHHIKDCIVFPARGKRPHPDEMAGSDLDGDEYALFWGPDPEDDNDPDDPKLIFPDDNHEAMDYPANAEDEVKGLITVEHMIDFICRYIQHDNIGLMANAYLAWADYNTEGIFSDVCKKIAKKYPQALDFAKSGTTQSLEPKERPKYYPDFMEKGCQNNSYKSEKALGLLYRVIRNLEASVSNINHESSIVPDMHLEYPGWEMFEKLAKQRKSQYTKRVLSILKKFGLRNEAEALTGYLGDISECNKNKYDSENVSLLSRKYLVDTMRRYHLKFIKDCEEQSSCHLSIPKSEIPYMMASAWYMVTYQDYETTILSFPWIVSDYLCKIPNKNTQVSSRRKLSKSMFIDNFDVFLQSGFKNKFTSETEMESCYCVTVLYHAIKCWVQKSAFILTISSQDIFCIECFNRIIRNFKSNKMKCCSGSRNNHCNCYKSCSPMKMILEFFKYYACEMIYGIGSCGNSLGSHAVCEGFRVFNLQSLALKTYAVIAITQSVKYLGLIGDDSVDNDIDSYEEGDPIRVRVNKEFEDILTGRVDEVCQILKDLSGVKQVFIDGSNNRNAYYILVQSIGKAFNRWNLEELIMDPKCPDVVKSRLQ